MLLRKKTAEVTLYARSFYASYVFMLL